MQLPTQNRELPTAFAGVRANGPSLSMLMRIIQADAYRFSRRTSFIAILKLFLNNRTFRPVLTMRLCQWTGSHWGPFKLLSRILHRLTQGRAGLDLPWNLDVGHGLLLVHGWGIVINQRAKIGANVTLFNGVIIGQKDTIRVDGRSSQYPVVGNEVWIGPHAIIIGGVTVGDGAIIGPGSVVTKDVPAKCVVVGNPARVLRRDAISDVPNLVTHISQ
jgi:serine O-acetyltransferase